MFAFVQAYYDSVVELYAEWGVDLIKWDCMYEAAGGYAIEMQLASNAVDKVVRCVEHSTVA